MKYNYCWIATIARDEVQINAYILLCRVNQDGVFQAQKVCRVPQELLAFQERRVTLDYLVFLDKKVKQDRQGLRG